MSFSKFTKLLVTKNQSKNSFIWLPTEEQELLLKAALINDPSAILNWEIWTKRNSPQTATHAEKRFYPLVYHNLRSLQFVDDYTDLLKKSHRESFKKNIALFQTTEKVTSALRAKGIRTILLKGIPLAVHFYPSAALRPMSDVDLMIEPENVLNAVEILKKDGWQTNERNVGRTLEIIHSCQFLDPEGKEIDLHWRLLRDCWNANKNTVFWESAVPFEHQMIKSEMLSATDQLFHVCCHGARYNPFPPIRWVADAYLILKKTETIEWSRLIKLGKTYRQTLPLFFSLQYLKNNFGADIPEDFLQKIQIIPKTGLEKMSFEHFSEAPQKWTAWRFVKEAAFQYSSLRSSTDLKPRSLAFIKYLQQYLTREKIAKKISSPLP